MCGASYHLAVDLEFQGCWLERSFVDPYYDDEEIGAVDLEDVYQSVTHHDQWQADISRFSLVFKID